MLLILEIWLTVTAWRTGWNGWALFPGLAALLLGVLLGASGMDQGEAFGIGIGLDVLTCIVLGVMAAMGRTRHENVVEFERLSPASLEQHPISSDNSTSIAA